MMKDFEKAGFFYLGKEINPSTNELENKHLLYDSKNMTTHAVCLGMTGSGKTGLGISIIEEAALNRLPALIIDPKGDLTNLLLTFPDLSEKDFIPWVDHAEAERKGVPVAEYADSVAKSWKKGLKEWDETPERIRKFRNNVEMIIYTPASEAGVPLSISSFAAPSKDFLLDKDALRGKILSTASGILGLLGLEANPIKSREHILISSIISQAWHNGEDLSIESLIQQVQKPPFEKIGTMNLDTFFPQKDRMALSINLNNLLASPGFHSWMEGEPLDIQKLLYTEEGKPKLAILYIAHLSEAERMFFITLLLNEFLSWMRQQPGTSSLRALLYMDEIFGFFPPIAMPPSKTPMLTLLKQARAYGIGIILSTQNPVDLDYKGLSNCGTWFIGKLQTERDRARVIEGLNTASNGEIDSKTLDRLMSAIGKRVFLMRSIYEKEPILFQTRWTLSYLRGPLTLTQIQCLTDKTSFKSREIGIKQEEETLSKIKPQIPLGIEEYFIHKDLSKIGMHYAPCVLGIAKLHFVDSKSKLDKWVNICKIAPFDSTSSAFHWENGKELKRSEYDLDRLPLPNSIYEKLPGILMQEKNFSEIKKSFFEDLYQNQTFTLFQCAALGLISKEGESEGEFHERVLKAQQEKNEEKIKKVKEKYGKKLVTLNDKIRRCEEKLTQRQQKVGISRWESWLAFGSMLLGALFGRKITKGTITGASTTLRRAGKVNKDNQDVQSAEEDLQRSQNELKELQVQIDSECTQILTANNDVQLEKIIIRPRKSDIDIDKVAIAWYPLP